MSSMSVQQRHCRLEPPVTFAARSFPAVHLIGSQETIARGTQPKRKALGDSWTVSSVFVLLKPVFGPRRVLRSTEPRTNSNRCRY